MDMAVSSSCSLRTIDSSSIGFKLLQKHGWKEGTGLGISDQGRLEPVETYLKNNKLGLGAENLQIKKKPHSITKESRLAKKKRRKIQELEKRMQEKEFERAFCREGQIMYDSKPASSHKVKCYKI